VLAPVPLPLDVAQVLVQELVQELVLEPVLVLEPSLVL